ncbi:MAG: enoyl-CoA hydratase/isomerase family protein [Actinobacteria bacterium]|nr:enoyl-CoA hydratase/isomerase family protein [Actinomycetota bacterium]MBU2687149.1 enoyl-CoA hydratase/isomerase family protein [Actinomycetota bacterium]
MSYKYLKSSAVGSTLWVEIHNPHVNFLTLEILQELWHVLGAVERDDSVRVLVVTGGIEDTYIMHFSIPELQRILEENKKSPIARLARFPLGRAVLDGLITVNNLLMDRFPSLERANLLLARALGERMFTLLLWLQMQRLYRAVERSGKVTVAAINGNCNGGGSELSACFDFRFMVGDRGFAIGQPEVLVGIIPGGGGTQRWPRLIGKGRALGWMLTGAQLEAGEAREMGIVTDVFPAAEFTERVQAFCDLMARRPPVAVSAIKRAVHGGMDTFLSRGLTVELLESLRVFDTRDAERALWSYAGILEEEVDVPPEARVDAGELMRRMGDGSFTEPFEGR